MTFFQDFGEHWVLRYKPVLGWDAQIHALQRVNLPLTPERGGNLTPENGGNLLLPRMKPDTCSYQGWQSINWERKRVQVWKGKISFLWTDLRISQQTLPVLFSGRERWYEYLSQIPLKGEHHIWKSICPETVDSRAQTMEAKTSKSHLRMFSSSMLEERKPSTW